jgi:hypothetical protein
VCTVKTPDDVHRNSPKHVEFYPKNKFKKLVQIFGFIMRNKEYRPLSLGIIRPTRFVNNHIYYAESGRGILNLMGKRGLDCTGSG